MKRERERGRDKEKGRQEDKQIKKRTLLVSLSPCLLVSLSFCLAGCRRRDPEMARRAAVVATLNKLRSCAPEAGPEQMTGKLLLAVAAVTRQPNETSVQLIAHALAEPVEFAWPVYSLSSGRWLIGERGRAYLRDEQCREYKLKDRQLGGVKTPTDGRVMLPPGQSLTVTLSFPRLPDEVQMGVLIYAGRSLPFTFWPTALAVEGR